MIRITSYATVKQNSKNGNSGFANNSTTTTNVTTINAGVQGVNIWGQYHDHTADISGDMTGVGNITSNGNITTTGNVNANNVTATNNVTSNKVITGDINSSGNITTNNITANGTINASGNITTNADIYANNAYITNQITADTIVAENGEIDDLISENIVCENLTVTKAAHFFKLIIDEIKAAKGQIIVTPANAKIDKVVDNGNNRYTLYFRAEDADGKKIHNMFEVDDQILCQTFDVAEGVSYNVSNKFYWSKCEFVSSTPTDQEIDGQTVPCHYIRLNWTDKDPNTNGIPQAGDEVVMLGNRSDTTRQGAISIGAYNNPYLDNAIKAPFIIQYNGVNNYTLSSHRGNVISNGYNAFKGIFTTTTGDNIQDLIDDVSQGALTYMHTAYANSPNGQTDFSKTYFSNALYIGFCSNHTQSDASLTYQDYTWCRLKGSNGRSASNYALVSDSMTVQVDTNGRTSDCNFYVRGYQFDDEGRTEIDNLCQYTYVYEDSQYNYVRTTSLPILITPSQDDQAFANGLKKIKFEMYNDDEDDFIAQLEIPIIRDGAKGDDGDADALEEYKLVPVAETVPIDKDGTVGVNLQYNIIHIVGNNYEMATASNNLCVYFKPHYQLSTNSYTALSTGTTTPTYTNTTFQTNWNTSTNKLLYLDVVLATSNPDMIGNYTIYDKRIVYAELAPSATFEITDEIKSTVQGHTTSINSLTNSISTIQQAFDLISLTVEAHTTQINNIDSRVTTNTTNIANISLKADSIESTVQNLKTGARNLFNFTNCRWTNSVPFIQGYGIEGKGANSRIYNLGFDGIGGDFAVSCWMRMRNTATNVSVNLCDVYDASQINVNVTTEWTYYQFIFNNVTNYIGDVADTSHYNGFLDFESNDINTTNRLYVKDLMIVRGNVPSDFNYSWKDYESANSDNLIEFTFDENISPTQERYKGYIVYEPTLYNEEDGTWTDFIFANNINLKQNTPYTLSFFAKCENPCLIESFLNGNGGCVDGTITTINATDNEGDISISNYSDGDTTCRIGTTWKQYIIHWYNQNSGLRNLIVYRDSIDNWDDTDATPNLSICGMEFHEGYWNKELLNSQSMIRQTATSIELAVNNTGINIYDGTITLNAENTTINGNLNLTNPKQGLILYDEYGNPKISIQNDTLGNLEDFDFGIDKLYRSQERTNVGTQTYNVTFPIINLGNFQAGQKLELHDFALNTYNVNHCFDTEITRLTYNYVIKCGSTTVATQTGTATIGQFEYTFPDYTVNSLSLSGSYTIEISFSAFLATTQLYGEFAHGIKVYCRTIQPSINKIATDGAVFASSTSKYNWFGSDQTMIKNGATAFRIKDGKIERNTYNSINPYANTNFSDISTTMPFCIINQLTYTATFNDGVIVFSTVIGQSDSAQRTLYLPNPTTCAGKKYYLKNKVGSNTRIYVSGASASDQLIMNHETNNLLNNISVGAYSTMLISDGFVWLEFNC